LTKTTRVLMSKDKRTIEESDGTKYEVGVLENGTDCEHCINTKGLCSVHGPLLDLSDTVWGTPYGATHVTERQMTEQDLHNIRSTVERSPTLDNFSSWYSFVWLIHPSKESKRLTISFSMFRAAIQRKMREPTGLSLNRTAGRQPGNVS